MLALTKKTEYALMALCDLAQRPGVLTSAREIAERHHIPLPLLMNILKMLQQNELLESVRGSRGGYRLSRPPGAVSLADVIAATERPVRLVACAGAADGGGGAERMPGAGLAVAERCELECSCSIRAPLRAVHDLFEGFVRKITLAELAFHSERFSKQTHEAALRVLG